MGQSSNNKRNASLDQKDRRRAGRQNDKNPETNAIKDFQKPLPAKGKTAGAFGAKGKAQRKGGVSSEGAGGGGLAQSKAKDSHLTTSRSSRPAKKR